MPTIVFSHTFDTDIAGEDDKTANVTWAASPFHTASGSLRINPSAAVGYWYKTAASKMIVMQAYIRFATRPTETIIDIFGSFIPGVADIGVSWIGASNKFAVLCGDSGAAEGPTISADTWYKLDVKMDSTAATLVTDVMVDGTPLTQRTFAGSSVNMDKYLLGTTSDTSTSDYYFDDFFVSNTAADYPLTFSTASLAWLRA